MPFEHIRRYRLSALVLAAFFVLPGCVPDVEEPEVTLSGIRFATLGLEGGRLYVGLRVVNPNDVALESEGLEYTLELADPSGGGDWVHVADGRYRENVRVGAEDSITVEIPVDFRYATVGSAVRSLLRTGTFDYRIRGTVALAEPIRRDLPFERDGTIGYDDAR